MTTLIVVQAVTAALALAGTFQSTAMLASLTTLRTLWCREAAERAITALAFAGLTVAAIAVRASIPGL